jgi:hypothetical protein
MQSFGNGGGQLQGVKFAAHPPAERFVDQFVLDDAALAGKRGRYDMRRIMIAIAGKIGDRDLRIG